MRQIAKVFKQDFLSGTAYDSIEDQINRYLRIHQDQTIQSVGYAYCSGPSLVREALVIFNKEGSDCTIC